MKVEWPTEKIPGAIGTVVLGKTAEDGGTRKTSYTIGGGKSMPFIRAENGTPNRPRIAMEVHSAKPDFKGMAAEELAGVLDDPVAWAKGSLHHYYAFFDPAVQGRYARTNQTAIREFGEAGGSITKNEHHQILEQGGNIDEYVRSLKGGNVVANVTRAVKGQSLALEVTGL